MSNSEASVFEREVGLIAVHPRASRLVSEAELQVVRGRQIAARQRNVVAEVDVLLASRATALLETFERLLALFEANLAACKRSEFLTVRAKRVVASTAAIPQAVDASKPVLDHDQRIAIGHIMEILREGGYHCELLQKTLH